MCLVERSGFGLNALLGTTYRYLAVVITSVRSGPLQVSVIAASFVQTLAMCKMLVLTMVLAGYWPRTDATMPLTLDTQEENDMLCFCVVGLP